MKISIKVTPNSKTEGVTKDGDIFFVRVKEPPKEGKANRAVIKLLAGYFKVSPGQVSIIGGYSSRNKNIEIL
ncbi:MAG TPA: DUF167 domain-containing protein [Dehalococcoidia bacterium]|jgi:uncharacterized protein (TIGR00251 family)